jgi:hypothetical protein
MRSRPAFAFLGTLALLASASRVKATPSHIELAFGSSDTPPREFRVFKKGINPTDQGDFLFDDRAAELVLAAFKARGVDGMIDLNHLSVDAEAQNYDPDARGWYKLEVRSGELWAVVSSWTADGAERLTSKKQRYASPALNYEKLEDGSKRVTEILNIAIVAMPATSDAYPLVAAARKPIRTAKGAQVAMLATAFLDDAGGGGMSQESLPAIAEAFGLDPGANVEDIIAAVAAWLASAKGEAADANAPPPADGGSPITDVDDGAAMRRMARKLIGHIGLATSIIAKAKPHDKQLAAFRTEILRDTGVQTTEEARLKIGTWRLDSQMLRSERAQMAERQQLLDDKDRVDILVEGVRLMAITPAKAWAKRPDGSPVSPDDAKGIAGKPSTFFSRFTIAELRAERDEWRKAKGATTPQAPGAIVSTSPEAPTPGALAIEVTLSTGVKKLVELKDSEVARARATLTRRLRRAPTDVELQNSCARYALMKGKTEAKNPELVKKAN